MLQKVDAGTCPLMHSVAMRDDYQKLASKDDEDYRVEEEVLMNLRSFVKECNRKIAQGKKRLEENPLPPELQAKVSGIILA